MMNKPKALVASLSALVLLAGCAAANENAETPALITKPTQASRAALRSTLSELFAGLEVTVADDALTRSSLLGLQQNPQQKLDSQPALGQVVTDPFRFRLIKIEDGCYLVDPRDGKPHLLANTTCIAEP